MVAKVRSNPFAPFIRKIGFSVGLENTLERVKDFARLYQSVNALRVGDIKRLLHELPPTGWNLDDSNEHILDVLRSLRVVDVRRGEVSVLELGEALGVLYRLFPLSDQSEVARRLLTLELVLADGDIFLNALASNFDPEEFRLRAVSMIEYKRDVLDSAFVSSGHRAAIYAAINIEAQTTNSGSSGKRLDGSPDPDRLKINRLPLENTAVRPIPIISDAYLAKALPRRRAWAISLGLADERSQLLPLGASLLDAIASFDFVGPNCLAVWPLRHELLSPLFVGRSIIGPRSISSWEFMTKICASQGGGAPTARSEYHDADVEAIRSMIQAYSALNETKSILRREMPVRVAYRCAIGRDAIVGGLIDVPAAIESEQGHEFPRIHVRTSRVAEQALSDRGAR